MVSFFLNRFAESGLPSIQSVAGGVFNSALQLGITIILSISTTIQGELTFFLLVVPFTSVLTVALLFSVAYPSPIHAGASPKGYQSSFFFLMAVNLFAGLLAAVLFVNPIKKV